MFNPWAMMMAGGGGGGSSFGGLGGMNFMRQMMETQSYSESMSYKPRLIYGVKENDLGERIVSSILIDGFAPHVQTFASSVSKFHACEIIYGCEMTVGEALSGEKMEKMKTVDRFAKKFEFGKAKMLVGIKGNYKLCHTEYEPDGKKPKAGRGKKDDADKQEELDVAGEDGAEGEDKNKDCGGPVQKKRGRKMMKDTDAKGGGKESGKGKGKQRKEDK
jgi:hypothetical protein